MSTIKSPHARPAAEHQAAQEIAAGYRAMSQSIRRDAFLQRIANKPLTARVFEERANIAKRAAIAEETHPDSPERPCRVCGGDSVYIP